MDCKLIIINGPNLNLIGTRETSIYGKRSFVDYLNSLRKKYPKVEIDYFQSNIEGEIITTIQQTSKKYSGIIINAGGFSHTSVSIADAISAIQIPVIEVHISNLLAREPYRHVSLIGGKCKGSIMGFGLDSYKLAVEGFLM